MSTRVIFLDRDGVINRYPGHFKYVTSLDEFELLPGVKEALRQLIAAGCILFVISNQAGVSKGIYSQETLDAVSRRMAEDLGPEVGFAGVYYCTHSSDAGCSCRKPRTGHIEKAFELLNSQGISYDRQQCYFIGDSILDVETGKAAGMKTILVFSGKEQPRNKPSWPVVPDFTAEDISDAVDIILRL